MAPLLVDLSLDLTCKPRVLSPGIPTPFRLDAPTKRLRDLVWPEIVGLKRFGEKHNTVPLPAEDMLDCPITTLVGSLDIIVNPKTNRSVTFRMVSG